MSNENKQEIRAFPSAHSFEKWLSENFSLECDI